MRNLKKILALVLSLMMVLSVMVTASAADFSDADEIQYTEAVDVMSALGILAGVDGKFVPQGTLTRAQAAKIITFIALGANADALVKGTGSDQFTDVTGGWAYDYISYCANQGIINGYGNGNFGPDDNVTGHQFGKMVLTVLGIDGTYTGSGWEVNVAKDLKEKNLTSGLAKSFSLRSAITREEAAQMAWNAMSFGPTETVTVYEVMGITDDFNTAGAAVIAETYGTKAEAIAAAAKVSVGANKAKLNEDYVIEEIDVEVKDTSKSLAAVNYALASDSTTDNFGRPGYFYYTDPYGLGYYNKNYCTKLATFYDEPVTYTVTNDKVTSVKAVLKELGLTNYATSALLGSSTVLSLGDTVELYANTSGRLATALVFKTDLAKVVKVVAADAKADYDYVVTLSVKGSVRNYTSDKLEGFDADTMVKDTYVTVYSDNTTAGVVAVATPAASGKVTATGTGYIKVDGTTYSTKAEANIWKVNGATINFNDDFDVYVDGNGYVIGYAATEVTTEVNVFYVKSTNFVKGTAFTGTYAQLEVVYLDGTTEIVDMAIKNGKVTIEGTEKALPDTVNSGFNVAGKFYAYTLNADGEVKALAAISTLSSKGYSTPNSVAITAGSASVTVDSSTKYATSTTTVTTLKDGKASTVTGYKKFTAVTYTATSTPILVLTKGNNLVAVYVADATAMDPVSDQVYGWYVATGDTYYSAAAKDTVTDVVYNVNGTNVTYTITGSTVADDVKGLAKIEVASGIATLSATVTGAAKDQVVSAINADYAIFGTDVKDLDKDVKFYDVTKAGAVTAIDSIEVGSIVTYVVENSKVVAVYVTFAPLPEGATVGKVDATYLEKVLGFNNADATYHAGLAANRAVTFLFNVSNAADGNAKTLNVICTKGTETIKLFGDAGISKSWAANSDHAVMLDLGDTSYSFTEGTWSYQVVYGDVVVSVGTFVCEK